MPLRHVPRLALALLALLFLGVAHAGPFGLRQGMTVSELRAAVGKLERTEGGNFQAVTVPKPHSEFERYLFIVSATTGLCKIVALGRNISNDAYGVETKSRFNKLTEQLTATYGEPTDTYDYLRSGSIWNEPNEWMSSLSRKERVLERYWHRKDGTLLKDSVAVIQLKASALRSSTGYLTLGYEFANAESCLREKDASESKAL